MTNSRIKWKGTTLRYPLPMQENWDMLLKFKKTTDMETQNRFMDYYQRIQNGETPSFVGIHFGAEQYADLADAVLNKISFFMKKGDLRRMQSWIEYGEKLRTRKRMRWFNTELREFNGE